jgi:Leucine-rich repeat (LRR) protein
VIRPYLLFFASALCFALTDPGWIAEKGGAATRDSAGKIVAVDLRSSWVSDMDIVELARMPDLKTVDLSLTRISDQGLRLLRTAPGIVDLNLYYAELITDDGLSAVRGWKHLKRINLRGTKITDKTLEMLTTVPTLEALDVGFAEITDVGLDHLAVLPNLRELTIGGNKLTDLGMQILRQLSQLTYLDLSGAQRTDSGLWSITLTDAGLESVSALAELRELRLNGTPVSGRGLGRLKGLDKLERLHLQGCKRIGSTAVPVLAAFARLRLLDVKDTGLTADDVAQLQKALPECKILH